LKQVNELSATLLRLATPGMKHKELLRAVRAEHPKASKKEIVRAAFYALIGTADADPGKAQQLQSFALAERQGADYDLVDRRH
jgi:hypothetical protein